MCKEKLIAHVRDNQRLFENRHMDAFDKLAETFFFRRHDVIGTNKYFSLYDYTDSPRNRMYLFDQVRRGLGAETYKLVAFQFDPHRVKIMLLV